MSCFDGSSDQLPRPSSEPSDLMESLRRMCACVAIFIASTLIATTEASEPVSVEGVYLLLSDDIDVPAREAGILSAIAVTEGQFVNERDLLANIEDRQARLERD